MSRVTRRFFGMIAVAAVGCVLSGALVRGQAATAPTGTATITGKVTSNGAPVSGATVNLLPPRARRGAPATQPAAGTSVLGTSAEELQAAPGGRRGARQKPIATTTTAADGTYTFSNVAAGTYSVMATLQGTGTGRGTATVADGASVTVDITLMQRPARQPGGGGGAAPGGGGTPPPAN